MRGLARSLVLLAAAGALLSGSARAADDPPAVLDAATADGRRTVPLAALIASEPLAPGENVKVKELFRDADTSHHVVWIRGSEERHRHDAHALTVVVLRGSGTLRIGSGEQRVGPGSILYVPRGSVHQFRNASSDPAVAYAIYSPPFDGKDRVVAE